MASHALLDRLLLLVSANAARAMRNGSSTLGGAPHDAWSTGAVAYGHPTGPCGGRIALPVNDSYRQPMRASRIWDDDRSRTSCNPGHFFYDPRKPDGTRPSQVAKV